MKVHRPIINMTHPKKTDPFDPLTHDPSTHCLLWSGGLGPEPMFCSFVFGREMSSPRWVSESLKLLSDVTNKMLAYNFIASCLLAMRATRALRLVEPCLSAALSTLEDFCEQYWSTISSAEHSIIIHVNIAMTATTENAWMHRYHSIS